MAAALGYHAADPDRGPRLCFHLKPGSYGTTALIEVLEQMKIFYRGENVVLVCGLSAHWSRAMRAWAADQDWLTLERLPAYATPTRLSSTWSCCGPRSKSASSPISPATTSRTSPTPPNKASTASTQTPTCSGPS